MALKNYDLLVTNPAGTSQGYVLYPDNSFGSPIAHSRTSTDLNIPFIGHQWYIPNNSEKDLSFSNWSLGAGQESYDTEDSSPDMFWDSVGANISVPGELTLSKGLTATGSKPAAAAGKIFVACGYFWWYGTGSAALKTSTDGATWTDVTGGTSVGVVSGWATDGTRVWVCSKDDTTNAIYVCTYSSGWSAASYGTSSTDEKVHDLAYNGGYLYAVVEDSGGKMRVAIVDNTTGAAAASGSQTSPVMLGATATVALVSCSNAVYWVTTLGNQTTVYEVTYDPDSSSMFTEQYMECPTDFICTCAIGYLSTIYLGGYYWSTVSGVGQGAVYFVTDGWASPLFEIGEKPESTPIPADVSNNNIVRDMCDGAKDLYVITDRGVYRWDIDSAGYSQSINFDTITGSVAPPWDAAHFNASDYPATDSFFPTGWTSTDNLTETKVGSVLKLTGSSTTTSEGYITSAMAASSTGNTAEVVIDNSVVASASASTPVGSMELYLRDATYQTKLTVTGNRAYLNSGTGYVSCPYRTTLRVVSVAGMSHLYVDGNPVPSISLPATALAPATTNEIRITFTGNFGIESFKFDNTVIVTNIVALPTVYSVAYNKGILLANYKLLTTSPSTYTYYVVVINQATYLASGWLQSSTTAMKSGSIKKFFRCIDVSHDPLELSATIGMEAIIDGQTFVLTPTAVSSRRTRFVLNEEGHTFAYKIRMYAGTSAASTPVIRTISTVYDFQKYTVNSYVLHCAAGAKSGTWNEDVQAAITFIFDSADKRCSFEDRFNGTYSGSIYAVEFLEANFSVSEGYSGVVRLQVKEED